MLNSKHTLALQHCYGICSLVSGSISAQVGSLGDFIFQFHVGGGADGREDKSAADAGRGDDDAEQRGPLGGVREGHVQDRQPQGYHYGTVVRTVRSRLSRGKHSAKLFINEKMIPRL